MSHRQAQMLQLRELLQHLLSRQDQLEWSEDPNALDYLTESMLRDLERCKRVCQQMHRRPLVHSVN